MEQAVDPYQPPASPNANPVEFEILSASSFLRMIPGAILLAAFEFVLFWFPLHLSFASSLAGALAIGGSMLLLSWYASRKYNQCCFRIEVSAPPDGFGKVICAGPGSRSEGGWKTTAVSIYLAERALILIYGDGRSRTIPLQQIERVDRKKRYFTVRMTHGRYEKLFSFVAKKWRERIEAATAAVRGRS